MGDLSDDDIKALNFGSDDEGTDKEEIREDPMLAQISVMRPQFTKEQLNRFAKFRQGTFPKQAVKDIMKRVTKKTANDMIVAAMIGITKVFVGEIVETARTAMDEWGEKGAIQPRHIREAYRRLKIANKIPYYKKHRRVFRRHR